MQLMIIYFLKKTKQIISTVRLYKNSLHNVESFFVGKHTKVWSLLINDLLLLLMFNKTYNLKNQQYETKLFQINN